MTVYRVIAEGTHIQPLRLVVSKRNGFHKYEILEPDPLAGTRFNTRKWYADPTPLGACLTELEHIASRQHIRVSDEARYRGDLASQSRDETRACNAIIAQIQMIASKAGLLAGGGA